MCEIGTCTRADKSGYVDIAVHVAGLSEPDIRHRLCGHHAAECLPDMAAGLTVFSSDVGIGVTEHYHTASDQCPGVACKLTPGRCYGWRIGPRNLKATV